MAPHCLQSSHCSYPPHGFEPASACLVRACCPSQGSSIGRGSQAQQQSGNFDLQSKNSVQNIRGLVAGPGVQEPEEDSWLQVLADAAAGDSGARRALDNMPEGVRRHLESDDLQYVSLMAGVGGRSLGYSLDSDRWTGRAVEMSPQFVAVHTANIPGVQVFEHKMTPEMALPPAFPRSGEVVHLSAGPPCQPYSKAGKGEGQEDPRDGIPAVLEAIEELMPLMVEIENVPEIQKYEGVVDSIVSRLNSLGYWVSRGVLVASDYGVPQSRRRFFIVGSLLGPMGLPEPTTADRPITVEEAIGAGTDFNAFQTYDPALTLTPGQQERAERLDVLSRCVHLRELHPGRPARTLTASGLANNHALMPRIRLDDGETLRRLSVGEAACLQSFPRWYAFHEEVISERQAYIGIGNAVPPVLGRHLSRLAREHVEKAREIYRKAVQGACVVEFSPTTQETQQEGVVPVELSETLAAHQDLEGEQRIDLEPKNTGKLVATVESRSVTRFIPFKILRRFCGTQRSEEKRVDAAEADACAASPPAVRSGIEGRCEALDLRADDGEAALEQGARESGADVGRAHGASQSALGPPPLDSPEDALTSSGVEEARSGPGTSRLEVAHGEIARVLTQELVQAAVAAYAAMPQEPGDCGSGRDELQPGGTRFEGERNASAEGLDADSDCSSVGMRTECGSTAAIAAVLTMAAMAGGVSHSYGPGDEDTRRQCLLAHRQAQERALRSRYARQFGPLRRVVAAVGPTTTESSAEAKGVSSDKLEEVASIDDVADAPEPWLDESYPLHFENLAFQVGENTIRRVRDAICDSGASFNVVDENTARHNERRGGPEVTWWRSEKAEPLYAVSGAPVIVVGTCMMTILLKDELSRRWKKFNTHFFVIRFPQPRVILGVPFMRKTRMVVDVNSDTVSLYHQGDVMATKVTTGPSSMEFTINSVLDCTHPLAFTMEEYTIPAGAGLGVRVQLPAVYEGLDVQLLPLPDSAREFFANKRGLRLHGPLVARCGAEGYVAVRINNFSDKSVVLPAHTPVAQYLTNPEIAPKADMTVEEIISAMKVDSSTKEEEEEIRRCIEETIFKDREARRMYFSQKRIGTGRWAVHGDKVQHHGALELALERRPVGVGVGVDVGVAVGVPATANTVATLSATPAVDALLDEKAQAAVGDGVLPDGRVVPRAVVCTWEACHAVLTQVAAVVASGSAKALSVDFEYTGGPRGRATGIALAQMQPALQQARG
ncbi:hypothetical protein AB1Y20_019485 [Prymnesium parvum]|uniref:DNA (cytosine-5-)-methyltransferase n=1 Tax=Prymnesium parvum TaxID=97485 RepID=A0AB34JV67_PRYPA